MMMQLKQPLLSGQVRFKRIRRLCGPRFLFEIDGFHVGGGINDNNASQWIGAGAEKVLWKWLNTRICFWYDLAGDRDIVLISWMSFFSGKTAAFIERCGERPTGHWHKVCVCVWVVFNTSNCFSCRRKESKWYIAMNKWQDLTDMEVNQGTVDNLCQRHWMKETCSETLDLFSQYCRYTNILVIFSWLKLTAGSEFLIHAADVEGLCQGIDEELVKRERFFS